MINGFNISRLIAESYMVDGQNHDCTGAYEIITT